MQALNRQTQQLETPADTSLVCGTVLESFKSKSVSQLRRENTPQGGPHVGHKHTVFVLSKDGQPLTPTTPQRARKLLAASVAKKCWSKFNTFGIQLLTSGRKAIPKAVLGNDWGSKFDGYSVVVGTENPLNVMWLLPDKKVIRRKLDERRTLRRARRHRNCRRRPARFDNRLSAANWLAPSQSVVVNSRLKAIRQLCRIYPIQHAAIEDVRFNHDKHRWGKNFSTVEVGKTMLKNFFEGLGIRVHKYEGWETKQIRENLGYKKTKVKNAEKFTAHCCDSLAIAVNTTVGQKIDVGKFIVGDDSYRSKRRRLHDTQPAKGGIRAPYSKGTVRGLHKGLLVGVNGKVGQLCGELKNAFRYYDTKGKRGSVKKFGWVSTNFVTRGGA
jgi:hypothetical protein